MVFDQIVFMDKLSHRKCVPCFFYGGCSKKKLLFWHAIVTNVFTEGDHAKITTHYLLLLQMQFNATRVPLIYVLCYVWCINHFTKQILNKLEHCVYVFAMICKGFTWADILQIYHESNLCQKTKEKKST